MPHRPLVVVALALAILTTLPARPAPAANQPILGKAFIVANPIPADPSRRRIRVLGREPSGSATIVGNPTVGGASLLVVINDSQTNATVFPLPAGGWSGVAPGFVYRDPGGMYGPVKVAAVRDNGRTFQVKAVLLGRLGPGTPPHIPIVPDGGTEGAADLTFVGGDSYCMHYGGAAGGKVTNRPADSTQFFKVTNPTSEAGCAFCGDRGGGSCGGYCPPTHFCVSFGATCGCQFLLGTSTSTSTSTTSSTMPGSPGGAFLERE
jgi:hypothetical protein